MLDPRPKGGNFDKKSVFFPNNLVTLNVQEHWSHSLTVTTTHSAVGCIQGDQIGQFIAARATFFFALGDFLLKPSGHPGCRVSSAKHQIPH